MRATLMLLALLLLSAMMPVRAQTAGMGTERFATGPLEIQTAAGSRFRFTVEIARSPAQQTQGLMYRPRMDDDAGMLFVNREKRPMSMWMKNTLIPLDMVFFDGDGRVVNIQADAVPGSLQSRSSTGPVAGVLELNGGLTARLGIRPGDRLVSKELDPALAGP